MNIDDILLSSDIEVGIDILPIVMTYENQRIINQ